MKNERQKIVDVSITIVNWNTKQITCNCLKSIFEQASRLNYEVIVIDNASTDGSVDMIKAEFSQVILVENNRNRGYAAGCNAGIRVAKGRYILLLNSDVVVLDNAVEKTVQYADKHPSHC